MRFGFVAASLTAHAAVVCLAWRFAPVGERAAAPRQTSGLPSDELEVTPWEPEAASDDAVRREVSELHGPPADKAQDDDARTRADETPLDTVALAREGAPPKAPTPPKNDARSQSPRTVLPPPDLELASDAAEPVRPPAPRAGANQPPNDSDWMNMADQLPDPGTEPQEKSAQSARKRDDLVERLLAKERDKARVAAREEAAARDEAARRNAAGAPKRAASFSEARTPGDETFGESRAHADLWVELTRWLPRAASSDPAWEQLPSNASYEFRIELVTEAGKLVESKVLDAAPMPTKKLLTNTSHLMERGRYTGSKRVVHRFELRIRLSTTEPRDLWIAHTTPDPPKPGVGSFIAPSGRRFDVWVSQLQ